MHWICNAHSKAVWTDRKMLKRICISLVAPEKVSGKRRKWMWGTAPEEKRKKKNRSAIAEHFVLLIMCQHPGAYWFFAGDFLNKAKASHKGPYKSASVCVLSSTQRRPVRFGMQFTMMCEAMTAWKKPQSWYMTIWYTVFKELNLSLRTSP